MAAVKNKRRRWLWIGFAFTIAITLLSVYLGSRPVREPTPVALRMDTNGVPYYHGIPIADTNMQAVFFRVMAAANKRFYIERDDNNSTNKSTWRQQYTLTRRMWKAGMP